jgi:hypothetical protein
VPFDPLAAANPVHRLAEPFQWQRLTEQETRIHRPAGEQVHGRAQAAQDSHRPGDDDLSL